MFVKVFALALATLFLPLQATAATRIVDLTLSSNCPSTYDPAARSCGGGNQIAYSSLASGLAGLVAGDTLQLRGGTYGQIAPTVSGTQAQPIVISGYPNETATVTGAGAVGLSIINRTDLVIRNLSVTNVQGFGRLENSTRIWIDNVDFDSAAASGTTGALKFVRSRYNRVTGSTFDDGSDILLLQDDSDFNVIQGNTFGSSGHSSISIRCSSQNVIRDNEFNNLTQKAMEVFDCEGVSDAPVRLDDARRNVIETNRFYGTAPSSGDNDYNAIQHGGQQNIVRYNSFVGNRGGGVNYQHYNDESQFVYGNRLYNNTFYDNDCYGIIGQSGPSNQFYDNRVKNNLLYQNFNCNGGGNQQTRIEDTSSVILTNNTLATSDPGFQNALTRNLQLTSTSNQIDAGAFVARAPSAGSGSSLVVDDANYFYDGFGIPGELGDTIRLQGSQETARVVAVDYATRTLTLDRSLSWPAGAGVHLNYTGSAPDVGAFEVGLNGPRPNAPTTLVVQ